MIGKKGSLNGTIEISKVLLVGTVLIGLCYPSDTLLTGVTRSLKAYVDHVVKPILNVSYDQLEGKPTNQAVTSLKDYLYQLPFSSEDNLQQNIQPSNLSNSNIVVMTRIGDNDKKNAISGEWIVMAPTKYENVPQNPFSVPLIENKLQSTTNHLRNETNVQEYKNSFQEVLYTFKDLVNIGLNPKVNEQITDKQHTERFNATYIMSIPKSTKFFELKVNNLTREQYDELNNLVKTHLQKNNKSTLYDKTELNNTYVVKKGEKRQVSSLESTKSSLSLPSVNRRSEEFWKKVRNEINLPLHELFSNNDYETFTNKIEHNLSSNFVDLNKKTTTNVTRPSMMNNNGFHAEIATDYMHKKGKNKEPSTFQYLSNEERKYLDNIYTTNLNNQSGKEVSTHINDSVILSILKKIYEQQDALRQKEFPKNNSVLLDFQDTTKDSMSNKPFGTTVWDSMFESELNKSNDTLYQPQLTLGSSTMKDMSKANSSLQEINTFKILNSSTNYKKEENDKSENLNKVINEEDQGLMNSNISDIGLSGILTTNSENQKRKNIDMSFFTDFFHNNESLLEGEDDNAKVMKINKQGNILDELKSLMLDYFVSLKLNTQDLKNYSSVVEGIIKSTNIFELMQKSSQFVKHNLKLKIQNEKKEPSTFVKKIIDIQVDKCKMRYNGIVHPRNQSTSRNTSRYSIKKINRWRFIHLTKCISSKVRECVVGFNMWLAKGRFYLRPQFKLQRAYENYEIERNLFCLRKYNATFLGSNLHGIRMLPGTKIGKKSGVRSKPKLGLKKSRKIGKGKRTRKGNMIRKQKGRMTNNTPKKSNPQHFQRNSSNRTNIYVNRALAGTHKKSSEDKKSVNN